MEATITKPKLGKNDFIRELQRVVPLEYKICILKHDIDPLFEVYASGLFTIPEIGGMIVQDDILDREKKQKA